jgi:hypothetical protein
VERCRINNSGNLGIGTTAPNAPIHIVRAGVDLILQNWHVDLPSANNRTLILYGPETDSTGDPFRFITGNSIQFKVDANVVFHALDNGRIHLPTVQANTTSAGANVNISSDFVRRVTSSIRYKKDITTATWGLAKVLQLKPVTFKNNASGDQADDKTYAGFTAEDVHELGLSEFVEYNQSNEPEGIYYANMVSLLTKGIQELNTKVETLETEKTKLQTDLTALTARVAALEAG